MNKLANLVPAVVLALGANFLVNGDAEAAPVCGSVPLVALGDFSSCIYNPPPPKNDTLTNAQVAIDLAIIDAPTLTGGYSPGPGTSEPFGNTGSTEFLEFSPNVSDAGNTFVFTYIAPEIDFLSFKQSNKFEIFFVGGLCDGFCDTPLELSHSITPSGSTSHLSAFISDFEPTIQVSAPGTVGLLGLGLGLLGWRLRRKTAA